MENVPAALIQSGGYNAGAASCKISTNTGKHTTWPESIAAAMAAAWEEIDLLLAALERVPSALVLEARRPTSLVID